MNRSTTVPTIEALRDRRDELLSIFDKHGAYNVRIFGSVARGEATSESDIDFLINYDRSRRTPWFPGGLILDLEAFLNCGVDITTVGGLSPLLAESVGREAIEL